MTSQLRLTESFGDYGDSDGPHTVPAHPTLVRRDDDSTADASASAIPVKSFASLVASESAATYRQSVEQGVESKARSQLAGPMQSAFGLRRKSAAPSTAGIRPSDRRLSINAQPDTHIGASVGEDSRLQHPTPGSSSPENSDSVGKSLAQKDHTLRNILPEMTAEVHRDENDTDAALEAAVRYTRSAKRKVSRIFGKAEDLVTQLMSAHMENQTNPTAKIRFMCDEYAKVCQSLRQQLGVNGNGTGAPPPLETESRHERFVNVIDDYRHVLQYELVGHHEEVNRVNVKLEALQREMYSRGTAIATAIQNGGASKLPKGVVQHSKRTWSDVAEGVIVQCWEHAHTAVKHYVKCLSRFTNLIRSPFSMPCVVVFEVCGLAYTCSSIIPLNFVVRNPFGHAEYRFGIEAATAELNLDIDADAATRQTLFASGLDGRAYCIMANGLLPVKFHPNFLNLLDPGSTNNSAELEEALIKRIDHAAVEAVAISRSNLSHVSKALHRHNLRAEHLGLLQAYLSRQDQARVGATSNASDFNLTAALIATNAEILARTLKLLLRRLWADNVALSDTIPAENKAKEMAVFAHQLVNLLVCEDHDSRLAEDHQLFRKIAELSRVCFPVDQKTLKKSPLAWGVEYVSEAHVASRLAHMTGLRFVDGVMCGVATGRFVRGMRIEPREMWMDVQRGRHQEVMKRLVSQIKNVRGAQSYRAFHLTVALADVFHQAQGRPGVSRSAADLFEQAAWRRRSKPANGELTKSQKVEQASDDAAAEDEEYLLHREMHILRILALQGITTAKRDIIVAEAYARDRAAASSSTQTRNSRLSLGSARDSRGSLPPAAADAYGDSIGFTPSASAGSPTGLRDGAVNLIVTDSPATSSIAATTPTTRQRDSKVPQSAVPAHTNALAALNSYTRRSTEITKDTGLDQDQGVGLNAGGVTAEFLKDRLAHARSLNEAARRIHVLRIAASALRDKSVVDMVNAAMRTLDRYRRQRVLEPRAGAALWNALFDALVQVHAHFDPDAAIRAAQSKLVHAEKVWGPSSAHAAATHSDIGTVLLSLGMVVEGRREFEIGFRGLTQIAPLSSATFTAANNLGFTYFKLGEKTMDPVSRRRRFGLLRVKLPPQVEALLSEAVSAFTFVLDNAQHAAKGTLADALNNLGSVHAFSGRFGIAIPLFERSLALTRGIYADDHPDRASAIRNLRTCEKRLRSNAALWISCFYKRFRARKQYRLMRAAAKHVVTYQRIGRAFFDRMKLFRLAEVRRLQHIGVGAYAAMLDTNASGGGFYGDDTVMDFAARAPLGSSTLPVPGLLMGGRSPMPAPRLEMMHSAAATPSPGATLNAPDELMSPSRANAATTLAAAARDEAIESFTPSQKAALQLIQGFGRGCLMRAVLRKLHAFRMKKKKAGK